MRIDNKLEWCPNCGGTNKERNNHLPNLCNTCGIYQINHLWFYYSERLGLAKKKKLKNFLE